MFDFSNYLTKAKYYDNLAFTNMKDETGGSEIEKLVGLKPKMYLFLVENSEHKKAKNVNKNVVAAISHNDYKDVLLNNEYIRHSINRIQCKDHRIGTLN